ncbi:Uncharacterized protein conserved in archaea [Archaeoglobus sulfaticallidus PM70-1]|uniref:Uncharacterized protein conserved in archaea n=1 Tax=Archaeoglobus sulfaticallidus PM70-1 TaxID=387631 RepID=N0BFU7_9EURY|nr:DUF357 domain-containing protein [Archaeoglobus sulfaticallidus]AGK61898.1 Uncharacterized protein conserved in archaea [Archaeoglobus sulfaticallidus PM70-1]
MNVEEELRKETEKWKAKIEEKMKNVSGDEDFLRNIRAYILDSTYFLEKGDLVRAFECIVWAWAWLEIGEIVGKLKIG